MRLSKMSPTTSPNQRQSGLWMMKFSSTLKKKDFPSYDGENPLSWWKDNQTFPRLARLSKRIFPIQASSGESERHFNIAKSIVADKISALKQDAPEALAVLKEALANKLYP